MVVTVPANSTGLRWRFALNRLGSLAAGQLAVYNLTTEAYLPV